MDDRTVSLLREPGGNATVSFHCRLCAGTEAEVLIGHEAWLDRAAAQTDARARMAAIVRDRADLGFGALLRCRACGLYSVETPPGPEALGAFYQAYYANENYGAKQDKKIARARRRIAGLKAQLRGPRFLDVGCNLGFAAEAARRERLDAHGIEIDADAVAAASRLFPDVTFACASAEQLADTGRAFDFLWCTEVIEHAPDFQSFARALGRLAAPGALLFLTTPDAGHWRREKDFAAWDEVKPPEHLQWFEARHLRRLFEPLGFQVRFRTALKPNLRMVARKTS